MTIEADNAVIHRAGAYYFQGRCDEAIRLLADFIAERSNHEGAAIRAAELLIDSERHAHALEYLTRIDSVEAGPRAAFLLGLCHHALGNPDAAERIADGMIVQRGRGALALVLKARVAAFYGKLNLVEELLAEAVESDPKCGIAWHDYAGLRRQHGDLPSCFNLSQKALECAPESREIACGFHEVSLMVQKVAEAEAEFRQALSGRRMDRRLRYFLIDLLLRQNKYAEAMLEIESAIVDFGMDQGILNAALKIRGHLGPVSLPSTPKPGGGVSLCIIAKNERNHLARCLASAKPFVDEIIVVDTGSIDETKQIAKAFGAGLYDFEWRDDFSRARNFALSKARGDWILVLDADETLSSGDAEEFRRMLEASSSQPVGFRMRTRNYSNQLNAVGFRSNRGEYPEEEGMGWYPSDKVRLFPNDPRIRFEFPVHELVEPSLHDLKIPVHDCPIPVHHYGTLNTSQLAEKILNYHKLGRKKIKNFRNAAALKEAAIQSAQIGDYAESIDLWRRLIKRSPRSAEAFLNMGAVCASMGRYAEAAANARKAAELDPELKEAGFNLSFALLMRGQAEKAQAALEALLKRHPGYPAAQFLLCVAYACRQEAAAAEGLFQSLRALPIGDYIGESFLDISKRFWEGSHRDYARRTLEAAWTFGCANSETRALLDSWRAAA